MNIGVQISIKLVSSFLLDVFPGVELLDHMVVLSFLRLFHTIFQNGCTNLQFHHLFTMVLFFFFPIVGSDGRVCLQSRRPWFNPWVRKIPWRRKWQPTPVSLPRKSHGWRSLASYILWGRKESDMTEQLHLHFFLHTLANNCYLLSF